MDMWQLFILCKGLEPTVRLQAFLLLVQIRCTVRTFYCVDVDLGLAERADLGGRSRLRGRFVQLVDAFDHQEDDESRQQKLYDDLNEITVCNDRCSCVLSSFEGRVAVAIECDQHIGEVDLTRDERDDWHDDVVDERADDVVESTADDNADCHIDHIAAHDEFLEFFYKYFHGFLL